MSSAWTTRLIAARDRLRQAGDAAGLIGLFVLSLSAGLTTAGIYVGLGLIGLGLVWHLPRLWRALRQTVLLWAVLGLGAYILVRTAFAANGDPETWDAACNYLYIAGVPALAGAFWAFGRRWCLWTCLGLLAVGLVVGLAFGLKWSDLPLYWRGEDRLGEPFAVNRVAVQLGGFFLAGLILTPVGLAWLWRRGWRKASVAAGAVGAAVLLAALYMVILTQSRQVWLALALIVPVVLGLAAWRWRGRLGAGLARPGLAAVAILLAASLGAASLQPAGSLVADRLQDDAYVWDALAEGRFTNVQGGMGKRFELWRVAGELTAERPVWGAGPGSSNRLIREHASPRVHGGNSHNLILELLVTLGGLGFLLILTVIGAVSWAVWRGWRRGAMPGPIALCLAAEAGLFVIVNCFDVHYHDPHTMAYIVVLTALATSPWLRGRLEATVEAAEPYQPRPAARYAPAHSEAAA